MKRLSLIALLCASFLSFNAQAMEGRPPQFESVKVEHVKDGARREIKHVTWSNAVNYAWAVLQALETKFEIKQIDDLKKELAEQIIGMHTELRVTVFYLQKRVFDYLLQSGFEAPAVNRAISDAVNVLKRKIANREAFYQNLRNKGIRNLPQLRTEIPGNMHPTWGKVVCVDKKQSYIQFTARPTTTNDAPQQNQPAPAANNRRARRRARRQGHQNVRVNPKNNGAENIIRDAMAIDRIFRGQAYERILLSHVVRKESARALIGQVPANASADQLAQAAANNGVNNLHVLSTVNQRNKQSKITCNNVDGVSRALRNLQPGNAVHFACLQGNNWILFTVVRKGNFRLVIGNDSANQNRSNSVYLTTINNLIKKPNNAANILNQNGNPPQPKFVEEEDFSSEG